MKMLFFAIELNLVMWVVVLGILFSKVPHVDAAKMIAFIGFCLAALIQHWAYYNIWKKARAKT